MIASVYIKDGNIHFYNEPGSFSNIGGIAYELGKPLLYFLWYDPEQFLDSFSITVEAYDNDFAHIGAKEPDYIAGLKELLTDMQSREVYLYFYAQMLTEFIYDFIESPRKAVTKLDKHISGAADKLAWTVGFEWPASKSEFVQVALYADRERRLFRAAKDVVSLMYDHLRGFQAFIRHEIEVLIHYREKIEVPAGRAIDYIEIMDEYHDIKGFESVYLEKPFLTFFGRTATKEVEQLYAIEGIRDLFRFEFIKMCEHDIFIKKCKNCDRFFIPRRRADTEYCDRLFGETGRKCSEVGATLRYEKKVAENPILEAHKKAYRRFNSRTRVKKMTQSEFMAWADEAAKKRDECLAGNLPFDEFVAWLEQGRLRKSRSEMLAAKGEKAETLENG